MPKIAFAYDVPPDTDGGDDVTAEYEDWETIEWMRGALAIVGDVVDVPWGRDFGARLSDASADVMFNITEADGGRNRESLVPAIAEALAVPCTGTDAVGLGISLDKMLTKIIAADLGIPTPEAVLVTGAEGVTADQIEALGQPVIVKPNTGGSSIGIHDSSVVSDPERALALATRYAVEFGDRMLVESFVPGREYTTAILERDGAIEVLPHAEVRVGGGSPESFYSIERKSVHDKEILCPVEPECADELSRWSVELFNRIECRDFARIDFRVDKRGRAYLLEINPLPGLSPYYSIFPKQAEAFGIEPEAVVRILIENALERNRYNQ